MLLIFYTNVNSGDDYFKVSTLDCSCKEGFKKISDEFVGCVPDDWVDYHQERYIYLQKGYTLDSNGDCCICEEGYTAVSNSPIICMYMELPSLKSRRR